MFKRLFDIFFSTIAILFLGWLILICYFMAVVETESNGLYKQKRVGQYGNRFTIYKLKTIDPISGNVTFFGKFFRKYKIDELPQLWNVFIGDMSIVGPRPDMEGYYDQLAGENRKILELKPGLTSEAAIKYFNEETILALQQEPLKYNDEVIFPDKVSMNLDYYYNHSFFGDIRIIIKTIFR